jgi:N-acetylmuramoyl-L-alanine amidase
MGKTGTIVLDPGHGGSVNVGGSDANHAVSPSGVLEKNITLDIARLTRTALVAEATAGGHALTVVMTRDADVNLSLADRAAVAKDNDADLLLSFHCNGSDGHKARGVEAWIRSRGADETTSTRIDADRAFAKAIQQAALGALKTHDANTKDRGVKTAAFGVLSRASLGAKPKACLLEMEFIDVQAVDELLNTGANSAAVRDALAKATAKALIDSLA